MQSCQIIHHNASGVLLILLFALVVDGDSKIIKNLLTKLEEQFYEAKLIEFYKMWLEITFVKFY